MSSSLQKLLLFALPAVLVVGAGCIFSPGEDKKDRDPIEPDPILANTSPANLITNLQTIYKDQVRNASQRFELYQDLFPPEDSSLGFLFFFQEADVQAGLPPSWGKSEELEVHRNMFQAQENRDIFSLSLAIQHQPAEPQEFPDPGEEDWLMIQATNVNLRLMVNPSDGFEVNGGQADFLFAPADDRWYLVEWKDKPRP